MRWPWVSIRRLDEALAERDRLREQTVPRETFDLVVEERDRLRAQVDQLIEHTKRLDRVDRGLTEEPRKPKEDFLGRMPQAMMAHFNGFGSRATVSEQYRLAKKNCVKREISYEQLWAEMQTKEAEDG